MSKCELCGEPMPAGETMFKYHGYSGPCPKPQMPPDDEKSERVHAMVNAGPYPGMSEAFDAHMGAACWVDPAYAPDASMWAAAWKAAKRHGA